jgi:hypothetical protein
MGGWTDVMVAATVGLSVAQVDGVNGGMNPGAASRAYKQILLGIRAVSRLG